MLRVDVFHALEALHGTSAAIEEILVLEEIVLPLIGSGIVEHDVDKLGCRIVSAVSFEAATYCTHGYIRFRNAVIQQHVHRRRDGIRRVLLVPQSVDESQAKLVFGCNVGSLYERVKALHG